MSDEKTNSNAIVDAVGRLCSQSNDDDTETQLLQLLQATDVNRYRVPFLFYDF